MKKNKLNALLFVFTWFLLVNCKAPQGNPVGGDGIEAHKNRAVIDELLQALAHFIAAHEFLFLVVGIDDEDDLVPGMQRGPEEEDGQQQRQVGQGEHDDDQGNEER